MAISAYARSRYSYTHIHYATPGTDGAYAATSSLHLPPTLTFEVPMTNLGNFVLYRAETILCCVSLVSTRPAPSMPTKTARNQIE
eukprot:1242432-Rhodomonas_salina.3